MSFWKLVLIVLAGVMFIAGPYKPLVAQSSSFGNCSADQVVKLLNNNFTRPEISKLCGHTSAATPANPVTQNKPAGRSQSNAEQKLKVIKDLQSKGLITAAEASQKRLEVLNSLFPSSAPGRSAHTSDRPGRNPTRGVTPQSLAKLEGRWTMDATCSSHTGFAHEVLIKNGQVSGNVNFGEDILSLRGQIDTNGEVELYGNGHCVLGKFLGKVENWNQGLAKGTLEVGGEAFCEGLWQLNKQS